MSENKDGRQSSNSGSEDQGTPIPPGASSQQTGFIPASPPRFISLNELMGAADLVTNMKLAHDIAVDDDFEVTNPTPPDGSLEKMVSETVKRAFWDMLSSKLSQDPPDYSQAISLIQDVKQMLIGCLLPQHQKLKDRINEVIDMDLIQQKIENEAFDMHYYAGFTIDLMSRMCAPARDEEVAQLRQLTDIVPLFKEILRVLEVMRQDMANVTIRLMRPHIKEQSVNYERTKFDEFLQKQEAAGVDGLEYTREWLERSYDVIDEHTEGTTMFNTSITAVNKTPVNVLNGAYIELLNWDNNVFPETCLVDQQRFVEISHNLRKLTLISSTLLVALTYTGDKLSAHTQLRDRLKDEIVAILTDVPETQYGEKMVNISEHIAVEINKELQVLGYQPLGPDQLSEYKERVAAVITKDHPVRSLLWKRIMTFIWQSLSHSSSQSMQLPPGFGAVSDRIASYCGKFLKLCAHNKAVFGVRYADVIGTLMNVTDLSPRSPQKQ